MFRPGPYPKHATHSSLFSPCLLVEDASVWATSLLGVAVSHIFCSDWLLSNSPTLEVTSSSHCDRAFYKATLWCRGSQKGPILNMFAKVRACREARRAPDCLYLHFTNFGCVLATSASHARLMKNEILMIRNCSLYFNKIHR